MSDMPPETTPAYVESPQATKARRQRSIAIALGLAGMVVLIFVITLLRYTANMATHVPH